MMAEVIKKLRLRLGLEQHEFGYLVGVSVGTVCNWEHNRRTPKIPKIRAMIALAKKHKVKLSMEDFMEYLM
jgi:DNA-binding transcriptional regulator YiaG